MSYHILLSTKENFEICIKKGVYGAIKSSILKVLKCKGRLDLYFKIFSSEQLPSAMKIIKQVYEESV